MTGFPYGTTARYEASTTSVNFSVTWEKWNRPGGVSSLFFRAKLACIFLTFILKNSIKAVKFKCQISLLLNHSTKTIQSPTMEQPWHLSAEPQVSLNFFPIEPLFPVPFHWVGSSPGIFQPVPHLASFDWVGIPHYLSTKPPSVSRPWVGTPWMFHLGPLPSIISTRSGKVTCSTIK